MFVVTINGVDSSRHSVEADATAQKAIYEGDGKTNVDVVEKDTFNSANTVPGE